MEVRNYRKYGLTKEQADHLLSVCFGACPLCHKRFSKWRPACVDHDHRTGRVRGLLCSPCNADLGALHEDVGWLRRAAEYLIEPTAFTAIDPVYVPGSPGHAGLPVKGHTDER